VTLQVKHISMFLFVVKREIKVARNFQVWTYCQSNNDSIFAYTEIVNSSFLVPALSSCAKKPLTASKKRRFLAKASAGYLRSQFRRCLVCCALNARCVWFVVSKPTSPRSDARGDMLACASCAQSSVQCVCRWRWSIILAALGANIMSWNEIVCFFCLKHNK
jgi:hypothetical protein